MGLEEELEAERQARAKAERQRSDLAKELESLGERLNEAGGATHAQVELNKKREAEVGKLRKDLEEANIQHESTLISLKKKHQDAVAEMSEQIDQLSKMKAKIEKDKTQLMHEIQDVRAATDEIGRSKASAEKSNKGLLGSLNDANKKVEEANLTLGDFENNKRKIAAENADLLRQLRELENQANMLSKLKAQLQTQLDEARVVADGEAKDRAALLGKFKNLEHELDGVKEHLDEESGIKEDLLRQVAKANNEADMWRSKYETEGIAKAEDIEMNKLKLQARLTEAQGTIEQLTLKAAQVEKPRQRLLLTSRIWLPKLTRLNFSMPPWRRRLSNLTNLSMNGNSKPNLPPWTLTPHKRNAEMPPLSSSESSLPMKNPSSNWMMFARRIRS